MKVLLINPPLKAEQRYGPDMAKFGPTNEPLGLAYIGAMLEKHGHQVDIWDGMVESGQSMWPLVDNADIIGVTILTPMYEVAKRLIMHIKDRVPDKPVVVGGAHPTVTPKETIRDLPVDHLVRGEGERAMIYIVEGIEKGHRFIPKIINFDIVRNIDSLPIPARHLLPMEKYQMTRSRSRHGHAYTVSVARGCPFDCAFCCRIFGKQVRFHSVDRIVEEIKELHYIYGAKEINLEADTLTIKKDFVMSLCEAIKANGLHDRIRFTCESRVDTVDEEMLKALKEAGCWQISYGVESGSQRLLNLIKKGITLEQVRKTFKITRKVGINIRAFFILGLPTETREESEKTIRFAKKLGANWSQFTLCTPFPGTKLHDLARSYDWKNYQTHGGWSDSHISYIPKGRTEEEMKYLQKKAYRSVYLNPTSIIRKLREIDSGDTLKSYLDGFFLLARSRRPRKLVRVPPPLLERFARGHYVDSPVYHEGNWFVRELQWRKLDRILSMYNGARGCAVDFCCGNGVLLPSLSRMFDRVIGYDLHVGAARELVNHYELDNVELIQGDGLKMPMAIGAIDAVFATSCLEHFEDIDGVIKQIKQILKPDGKLCFLVPTENILYRIGRKLIGYTKPDDHYWTGRDIMMKLGVSRGTGYPVFPAIYRLGVIDATV